MKQFEVCAWTIASGPPFTWVKKVKDSRELWWIIKFPKHRQLLKLCEQDLNTSQNNALEFCWILSRQNWEQNLGINPSMLEQPIGQLLRTEVHVFSDFVCVCVQQQRFSESDMGDKTLWSVGLVDTHGQLWYHGQTIAVPLAHIFRPHGEPNQERNSDVLGIHGTVGRIIFASLFNDIKRKRQWTTMPRKRKRGYRIRKTHPVRSLVLLWTWTRKSVAPLRAGTHQPENGIASPGKWHISLEKLYIQYSNVLNHS